MKYFWTLWADFEQYFQYGDLPSQQKGTVKHEGDPIFALPKLQLEMKSKQMQKLKSIKPGNLKLHFIFK